MTDVAIIGDTFRCPELRHEIPLGVPDAFLYVESAGRRHVFVGGMEVPRIDELGLDLEVHPTDELGLDDLVAAGLPVEEIRLELWVRACRAAGLRAAAIPHTFPTGNADRLRADGVELVVDQALFDDRRRVKTGHELAGIRRAQKAAEAGMAAARELLGRASARNGDLAVDGDVLTVETVKSAISGAFDAHGCVGDDFIVARGPQGAIGHDMGSGSILPGETVVIDLWPRDRESACFADMTRTFVVGGEPSAEAREWHRLTLETLQRVTSEVRPGADCKGIFESSCELFEANGYPTPRTKEPGVPLRDGYFHTLGHGVGLEVHEPPYLGRTPCGPLVAGDVITLEPGLYRSGIGGVRLEDLVLVTEDGCEVLTEFPYDLEVA